MQSGAIPPAGSPEEAELFRREALGAFAHEIRTPLTSIKMVIELARRQASEGRMVLDDELADMLRISVEDLQALADDIQETSRLERGRLKLALGPCDLDAAIAAAVELLAGRPVLEISGDPHLEGSWDAARLVRAIVGFAQSANRAGDGSGHVRLRVEPVPGGVALTFTSGEPGGAPVPIGADTGFGFFRARQLVLAMSGSVQCLRSERYAEFCVVLPLTEGDPDG